MHAVVAVGLREHQKVVVCMLSGGTTLSGFNKRGHVDRRGTNEDMSEVLQMTVANRKIRGER